MRIRFRLAERWSKMSRPTVKAEHSSRRLLEAQRLGGGLGGGLRGGDLRRV